jgi:hypothetical protein
VLGRLASELGETQEIGVDLRGLDAGAVPAAHDSGRDVKRARASAHVVGGVANLLRRTLPRLTDVEPRDARIAHHGGEVADVDPQRLHRRHRPRRDGGQRLVAAPRLMLQHRLQPPLDALIRGGPSVPPA